MKQLTLFLACLAFWACSTNPIASDGLNKKIDPDKLLFMVSGTFVQRDEIIYKVSVIDLFENEIDVFIDSLNYDRESLEGSEYDFKLYQYLNVDLPFTVKIKNLSYINTCNCRTPSGDPVVRFAYGKVRYDGANGDAFVDGFVKVMAGEEYEFMVTQG